MREALRHLLPPKGPDKRIISLVDLEGLEVLRNEYRLELTLATLTPGLWGPYRVHYTKEMLNLLDEEFPMK